MRATYRLVALVVDAAFSVADTLGLPRRADSFDGGGAAESLYVGPVRFRWYSDPRDSIYSVYLRDVGGILAYDVLGNESVLLSKGSGGFRW